MDLDDKLKTTFEVAIYADRAIGPEEMVRMVHWKGAFTVGEPNHTEAVLAGKNWLLSACARAIEAQMDLEPAHITRELIEVAAELEKGQ